MTAPSRKSSMRRVDFVTTTRSTGWTMPAGPASPAIESALESGERSAASVIEIKSLRYMSRGIITPRADPGRSVADPLDRFTFSRRAVRDQPVTAARVEIRLHREAADRAALGDAAIDEQLVLAGRQLDLARGEADFLPVDLAKPQLHRAPRAHDRIGAHDGALILGERRSFVHALRAATCDEQDQDARNR